MAAGILPKPGTINGPCRGTCKHVDCTESKKMAAVICRICNEFIGFGRRFYRESDNAKLVHAVCAEDEADQAR